MKKATIVVLSDCTDVAVNEIRAHLFSHLKEFYYDVNIEPSVDIYPFNITNGSFLLRLLADAYPENTIFYVVMNPVPDQPERIIGKTLHKNMLFCGRNTGVFNWLIQDLKCQEVYELPYVPYKPFGGKFIYPEIIAKFIRGEQLSSLAIKKEASIIRNLNISNGTVVHIDNFGIIKIMGPIDLFENHLRLEVGDKVDVFINGIQKCTSTYQRRIMAGEDNTWVVCQGSSLGGLPELCKVRLNGTNEISIKIGDQVSFKPIVTS